MGKKMLCLVLALVMFLGILPVYANGNAGTATAGSASGTVGGGYGGSTGTGVAGGDGYEISGQITLGEDAVLEHGMLMGWICAYRYQGDFLDMEMLGEGEFNSFFEGETNSFAYQLHVPKDAGEIVIAVRPRAEADGTGVFKSNILSDYVYYGDGGSSLDYRSASVVPVTGNLSGLDISLSTGVGFSWQGNLPQESSGYSEYTTISLEDKETGEMIAQTDTYIDRFASWENLVLPKEYLGREVYLSYDLCYEDDVLYTEPLYINPDGSCAKTREDAVCHTLTGANGVSFTAGTKVEFLSGIKGKITFEDGCTVGSFNCTIVAENAISGDREYTYLYKQGVGEYSYALALPDEGTYRVWAEMNCYDESSNVSSCDYYYTTEGMVYHRDDAEIIDTSVKNTGVDFEFKKTKTLKGRIVVDGEFVCNEDFMPELCIQCENGNFWKKITLSEDFSFEVKIPVNMQGRCTAYLQVDEGSTIIPEYYYYTNEETNGTFDPDQDVLVFYLPIGDLIQGKVKIPNDISTTMQKYYNVSLATIDSYGNMHTKQTVQATVKSGEDEAEFFFAVPKDEAEEYVVYGKYSGNVSGLYDDDFFYTGTEKSSIRQDSAKVVTGGTKDIVLYALKGVAIPITVKNPENGEYLNGNYTLDFGDFTKRGYFYLDEGESTSRSIILAEEHLGMDAYLYYCLDKHYNIDVYVNPDGSLVNNKKRAQTHRIARDTTFEITLSAEESLFTIPGIKGSLHIPETAYIDTNNGNDGKIGGNLYLHIDGNQVGWKEIRGGVGDDIPFDFEVSEIGEYSLSVYLDGWYGDTNLICGRNLYYTGTGWSENYEDAKLFSNETEQNLEMDLPSLPVLTGKLEFSEGTYLEEEIRYEITYTDVDTEEEITKSGYITEAEDFEYKAKGLADAEEYYVSVRFGSYYSQNYDTNIPYGVTYYYTEKGLTTDETAVRKAVKATDRLVLKMPVSPTIRGKVTFPEGAYLEGTGSLYLEVRNENGSRVATKEFSVSELTEVPFAMGVPDSGERYEVSVSFSDYDCKTNLESGNLYYTKSGMTGDADRKEFYSAEELSDITLALRQKRYVTGKLIAEDFVNRDDTLSARVEIHPEGWWTYRDVSFDEELNYTLELPSEIEGAFTIGFSFYEEEKNNIIKNEFYHYADSDGEAKKISYPNCTNIDIEVETGYIFSGEVKLPQDAVVYQGQDISGGVYLDSAYRSDFTIPYGERSGEFFMVVPKTGCSGVFYTSNGYQYQDKSENLYTGQVYYKDDNTSVVQRENAQKIRIDKNTTDGVIMLVTGEVYKVAFSKPAGITTDEDINLFAEIGAIKLEDSVTIPAEDNGGKASVVVPSDYRGESMYLYYDLSGDEDNELYREKVYINGDGSLAGSKKLAEAFEIDNAPTEIPVKLAKDADLAFPDYVYRSPYPYKDNGENRFRFEYTEGNCDYLKVTFAEETYFAQSSYSRRDGFTIVYGDNETMGPYYTNSLAGKTLNIPGNSFEAYITNQADASAFGFAIESIEPKNYSLETGHPYISAGEKEFPYTHNRQAEGLRLHFSEDTDFSGTMKITYTQNGQVKTMTKRDYNLVGTTVDVRGNSFTITLPADTSGSCYGFTIVEIEELEYCDVTFLNYDGTLLYQTQVEKGSYANYGGNTPKRERDEDYIYTFEGWDKSLENIQEDMVFTAEFAENPYATVQFKNNAEDETPLYTDYVILGEDASFEGRNLPSKPINGTKSYVFTGWSGSLSNIRKDTVLTAEFEECGILLQSAHPYGEEEEKSYTYEGSADSIVLYFSSDSMIESGDELIIYDEQGNAQHYLSGYLGDQGYRVSGKTAKLRIIGIQGGAFGYALAKVKPMWHDFSPWYTNQDPTCDKEGYQVRWCYHCYEEEERTIPALGHSFGAWQEDADGTVFKECCRCNGRELFDGDAGQLGIVNMTVVDGVTMEPIPDAVITAYDESNNESVWYTDEAGVASQMLNKGVNNLVIFADGYGMRNISVTVNAGVTNMPVVGLSKRPPLECELVAKVMDMEEIKAAGIDVTDPANSHVYKYKITIGFTERTIYFNKDGKYIKRDKDGLYIKDDRTGETVSIHPVNDKYYLVIYGQAKWLKEMFDVELVAMNTSNTDRIENLVAELTIPDGLSLATMNAMPQSDVQNLGDLAGGEKRSVHWYVRGDRAGEYHLSAKLTGTTMPFGEQFGYEYTTQEPVKVYAGNALRMNIVVPSVAIYGEDYPVRIEIENVSDRSVYNLSNSVDKVLQTKFLAVDAEGCEKYFEENALGYVAVDELKPGEKIVAELKSNILFQSDVIKDKIATLADRLREETDVYAIFNAFKTSLDLLNDNYDILDQASGNVTRAKEHLSGEALGEAEKLELVLEECKHLVKSESSSRAMYFINRLKMENTMEELVNLSKDANFYTVWSKERMNQLSVQLNGLKSEAQNPENCRDFDIYEDVKKVIKAVPVTFWFKDLFVSTMEGSTTEIPYSVQVLRTDREDIQVTNISNYYYNLLTGAIDRISQPWYTEIMGEVRDREGVALAQESIKMDLEKTLSFAVTDVSGDTRFHAWVEGENGKRFSVSSSAEDAETTEGGVTFTGPAYLSVRATEAGRGTLYVEKISEAAVMTRNANRFAFAIEAVEPHLCESEDWVEMVSPYDGLDGYDAKYCDVCRNLLSLRTRTAEDDCKSGGYRITEEVMTTEEYSCKLVFDEGVSARSAVAVVVLEDERGVMQAIGKDDIKIKPSTTVAVKIPLKNKGTLQPRLLLWDNFAKLRPIGQAVR